MTPFLVCEFGKSAISNLIKECFGSEFPEIFRKPQIEYIYRYLKDLNATTVLLESQYVDKDYLDDYSKFYVRRFSSKDNKCARLHFFTKSLQHQEFEDWLGNGLEPDAHNELKEAYLGFIVIKPLPRTFIGKTCLRVYPSFASASRFLLTRRYDVNLFGIKLEIKTIAFQEQDKVVAACATTAIWSALNAIYSLPVRSIPSCSEITTAAINFVAGSNNRFPSNELSQKQILRALDVMGYRHHSQSLTDATEDEIFASVECYLRSKIPLILGAQVLRIDESNNCPKGRPLGDHAMVVLGCETNPGQRALYVHDDRLGPFARAQVMVSDEPAQAGDSVLLTLREKDDSGAWQVAKDLLKLYSLVAITDKKVRLPLRSAFRTCEMIRTAYRAGLGVIDKAGNLSIDIERVAASLSFQLELVEISILKDEVLSDPLIGVSSTGRGDWSFRDWHADPGLRRAAFLARPFARFQWLGRFLYNGSRAFLVMIDATDIPQGDAVSAVYVQDAQLFEAFYSVLNKAPTGGDQWDEQDKHFFGSFMRRVAPRGHSRADFLDASYGSPRAPSRLKAQEIIDGKIASNDQLRRYYQATENSLEDEFGNLLADAEFLIWVIDHEGTLLVGREDDSRGHPTLTGFKPARVGGELKRKELGWIINSKSGRYSGNYSDASTYLNNALRKFQSIFHRSRDNISTEPYDPNFPT